MVKQGDIVKIDFNPVLGHEQAKYRPALVISNDDYNRYCGGIVLVCPISHSNDFPLHIELPSELKTDGKVLCEHIRALDINARKYNYVETVSKKYMKKISDIIKACVDYE